MSSLKNEQKEQIGEKKHTVEAERAIKYATFKEAVKCNDEAYRVSFLEKAKIYKVERAPAVC